jgi:hypothetical protein
VKATKTAIVLLVLIYAFLWFLEINGVTSLLTPLAIPLILAVMIAGGVALDRYLGVKPHKPKWNDKDDETEK